MPHWVAWRIDFKVQPLLLPVTLKQPLFTRWARTILLVWTPLFNVLDRILMKNDLGLICLCSEMCVASLLLPHFSIQRLNDVVHLMQQKPEWLQLFPELAKLLWLFLTIPVTSWTAERSFSCLRRLKTFLKSTITEKRLNHVALLHCHCERTDLIDLKQICNNFIVKNELRSRHLFYFHKLIQWQAIINLTWCWWWLLNFSV